MMGGQSASQLKRGEGMCEFSTCAPRAFGEKSPCVITWSLRRSDSDPNEIPEELRGSGALQRAGLLPRARVPEGAGGGEQQAGRFAWTDTLTGASSNTR